MIRKVLYAFRFMTCLPLPWKENEDLVQVSRSSGFFPLVGLIIGMALWGTGKLGTAVLNPLTVAFLQTLLWVILTGGLHLDGLSDTVDGLGSRQERNRMLEIMKDSNIGAFGALSLILQLMLKTLLCYELLLKYPLWIILAPTTARWGQLIAIRFFKAARKEGMGRFFQEHMTNREMALGLFTTIAVYLVLGSPLLLSVLALHGLFTVIASIRISKALGGLTGDVYGFICETGESFVLLALVVIFPFL